MAYVKTTWADRQVERPFTYSKVVNADGTITLTPSEGTVFTNGTQINAQILNNIEDGISNLDTNYTDLQILYTNFDNITLNKVLPPWTDVTLINNWTHETSNPLQYYKDEMGIVHFRGIIKPGILVNGAVPFTMPEEIKPKKNIDIFTKMLTTGLSFTTVIFESYGNCKIYDNITGMTALYLNNIHYRTDA